MTASEILKQIPRLNVLVVGDICLDRWCIYDPRISEPSRETGIPRVAVVSTEVTPGAAGTIASNLLALGAGNVTLLGAIGDDGHGHELMRALNARSISAELSVKSNLLPTFTYTKLINSETGVEDLARVDYVSTQPLPAEVESRILANLETHIAAFDVILVSDQAETESGGVVTPAVRSALARLAASYPEKSVWVDSRVRPEYFRNAILKPNHSEAGAACMRQFGVLDYQQLRRHTNAPFLVVTNGAAGVTIVEEGAQTLVKTKSQPNPVDVCGAGDSFSAGAAMAFAITRSPVHAARFGNMVASITVMKKGTGSASPGEVLVAEQGWPE